MIHIVKRTVSVLSHSYFFFPVTGWQATVATVNPLGVQTIDAGGDFQLSEDSSRQSDQLEKSPTERVKKQQKRQNSQNI